MSISIPPGLKKAVETGNLVLFVGAGLSCNLKRSSGTELGGWNGLVTAILDHLIDLGHGDVAKPLKQLVGKYDPITILDLIESHKQSPLDDISDFVKSFFKLHEDNDYDLHRKLYELSRIIVTTNYDCAFEIAVNELRDNKAYKGKNHELARYRKDDAPMLFKLHGCVEDVDSMVLFPSGYRELYDNDSIDAEHVLWVLGNIIYNKTILFLGTGLGDYQINNIFKRIGRLLGKHNQKHFIITTQNRLDSTLESFLSPITISSYDGVSQVIDQLLDIKREVDEEKKAQEQRYLQQLKDSEERVKSLTEKLEERVKSLKEELSNEKIKNEKQVLLLKREAESHFSLGVKYSLEEEHSKASEQYERVIELDSQFIQAYNNWGVALYNLAEQKDGKEADGLYEQAFEKYKLAVKYEIDCHLAYYNWGLGLCSLAQKTWRKDAEMLYEKACQKYALAITYNQDYHKAYNDWGNALCGLAERKSGKESEDLYKQAFEKYKSATTLKSDFHEAYNNWGLALYKFALVLSGEEVEELFRQAIDKFSKAIEKGGNAYYLATLYAIRGDKLNALASLDLSLMLGDVSVEFVETDIDWIKLHDDSDFKKIISDYKNKSTR